MNETFDKYQKINLNFFLIYYLPKLSTELTKIGHIFRRNKMKKKLHELIKSRGSAPKLIFLLIEENQQKDSIDFPEKNQNFAIFGGDIKFGKMHKKIMSPFDHWSKFNTSNVQPEIQILY